MKIAYKCRVEEIFKIPQGGFQSNRKRIKWRPHIGLKKQFKESVSMFLCKNHCLKYNLRGETSFCSQGRQFPDDGSHDVWVRIRNKVLSCLKAVEHEKDYKTIKYKGLITSVLSQFVCLHIPICG